MQGQQLIISQIIFIQSIDGSKIGKLYGDDICSPIFEISVAYKLNSLMSSFSAGVLLYTNQYIGPLLFKKLRFLLFLLALKLVNL